MSFWGWMTGADDAARATREGVANAQELNAQALQNANAAWAPYASAGTQGMDALSALMLGGGNVSGRLDSADYMAGNDDPGVFMGLGDITQDAGYKASMDAARNALNENQFLDGTFGSGPAAKEMASYMQDNAQKYANDAFTRALNTYEARANQANTSNQMDYQRYLSDLEAMTGDVNRKQNLAGMMLGAGQNAAGALSSNAMNWGANAMNAATGMGNANAQQAMGTSLWSGLTGLTNLAGNVGKLGSGMGLW